MNIDEIKLQLPEDKRVYTVNVYWQTVGAFLLRRSQKHLIFLCKKVF